MQIIPNLIKAVLVTAFFFLLAGGCTDYERAGLSPLPQNRPASWEVNPFGNSFRN